IFERGVDANLVVTIFKGQHLIMRQAESPVFLVVRSSIGNPLRMIRDGKEVGPYFSKGHGCVNRDAVIQDVQAGLPKVYNALPPAILYICVPDIPFAGYRPIENSGSGWHLEELQRQPFFNRSQCLPNPVTSDAPAD